MTAYNRVGHLTTVPYASSFLLFNVRDTTVFHYDASEEEFQEMPVNMTEPLGGCCGFGTPMLVDLDMFPPSCMEDTT